MGILPETERYLGFLVRVLIAHAELNYGPWLRRHERPILIASLLGLLAIPGHQWLWATFVGKIMSARVWTDAAGNANRNRAAESARQSRRHLAKCR